MGLAIAVWMPAPARALGPLDATLGFDYYRGPDEQVTWRPMGEIEGERDSLSADLEVSHFDDRQNSRAWGLTGTLKFPILPRWKLVAAGTGFIGDSTRGAWRAKLGPQLQLGQERTLGFYALHYDDRFGNRASGIVSEYDTPLAHQVSASGELSVQRSGDTTGGDAVATLAWHPFDAFEITGDAGVSHNATGLTGPLPPPGQVLNRGQGRGRSGRSGTASSAPSNSSTSVIALIGIRLHF